MLNPNKAKTNNGPIKVLNAPVHLGSIIDNTDNSIEEVKSIWVAQRDDTLVCQWFWLIHELYLSNLLQKVNAKKLEKAEAKLQEKQDKRTKEVKTVAAPKLQTATASQVTSKKESKLEAKGTNRTQDIRIENFDVAYGDR